jgi:hypothetical protein
LFRLIIHFKGIKEFESVFFVVPKGDVWNIHEYIQMYKEITVCPVEQWHSPAGCKQMEQFISTSESLTESKSVEHFSVEFSKSKVHSWSIFSKEDMLEPCVFEL